MVKIDALCHVYKLYHLSKHLLKNGHSVEYSLTESFYNWSSGGYKTIKDSYVIGTIINYTYCSVQNCYFIETIL